VGGLFEKVTFSFSPHPCRSQSCQSRLPCDEEDVPLGCATRVQLANTQASDLKNLSDGMEKLASVSDMEGVISYGAGFAGSHVIDLVFNELGEKANEILETDYTF